MDFSIIIPTYNRNHVLYQTIENTENVLGKITINYEIIVINDGTAEISYKSNNVNVYKNHKQGVASARNFGARLAKSENLIFMDDDILLTDKAAFQIIEFHAHETKNHILYFMRDYSPKAYQLLEKLSFGRYIIKNENYYWQKWINECIKITDNKWEAPYIASYCLTMKKSIFNLTGGYNEQFPFAGFEDLDFSCRLKNSSVKMELSGTLVLHNEFDRFRVKEWLARRYREGATRAVYIKLFNDSQFVFSPSRIKTFLFKLIHIFSGLIIPVLGIMDSCQWLDRMKFNIYNGLAGAFILKGYNEYTRKA